MSDSPWQYFSVEELSCHCGQCGLGPESMNPDLMRGLVEIRRRLGFPLPLTSSIRCPAHNEAVSHTGPDGPHTTGKAVDIQIEGGQVTRVVAAALDVGLVVPGAAGRGGLGFQQRGDHAKRFLHLDILPADWGNGPRPWVWSY